MTTEAIAKQLLPKPPRLLQSGEGYDWREFDRWLQRIYLLLGAPQNDQIYNISTLGQTDNSAAAAPDFYSNHQQEIRDLDRKVEGLALLVEILPNSQQEIRSLTRNIEDLAAMLLFERNNEQRLAELERKFQDDQTLYWMEA